jgi:hypothetical protein
MDGIADELDPAVLTRDELDAATRPRHLGVLETILLGAVMPIAWMLLPVLALWFGCYIAFVKARRSYLTYGRSGALAFETAGALILIPVVGLVSSCGTSLAFYLWSQPGKGGSAGGILAATIALSIGLIAGMARTLARHKSGRDVMPFEPGVNPEEAIDAVRKLRCTRPWGFLPGAVGFAVERSNQAVAHPAQARQPTFVDAIRSILSNGTDQWQLVMIASVSLAWVVQSIARGQDWWWLLLSVAGSFASLIVTIALWALTHYYEQLRYARRESVLHQERISGHDDGQGVAGARLDVLLKEVRALRMEFNNSLRRRRRFWR